jgi:hypothetical protein
MEIVYFIEKIILLQNEKNEVSKKALY